jgi:1-acyl-sn-glycerol-3-phosphate acyltransferase
LAKETGAKVVPLCINGAFEAWPRTAKFAKWLPIKVRIGKPLEGAEAEKRGYELGAVDPYHAICVAAREYMINVMGGG